MEHAQTGPAKPNIDASLKSQESEEPLDQEQLQDIILALSEGDDSFGVPITENSPGVLFRRGQKLLRGELVI